MDFLTNLYLRLKALPRFVTLPLAVLFVGILLIYYPLGMLIVHKVDDSVDFQPEEVKGGSYAVSMASGLIHREVKRHWAPNDPFFYPGAALTRMPAFQKGMISGVARFALSLSDQIARTRGTSTADPDVTKAVGLFNYPPTVWIYDTSVSWLPTASSEAQYRSAVEALDKYNTRLSQGQAVFDRRADNLLETLDRFASDLGSTSGSHEDFIEHRSVFAVSGAGELYYETKGKMYVYYMLMRELQKDFAEIIKEKQLTAAWEQTMYTMREGAELSDWVVLNADPDNQFIPSHLAAQGFYLMRARMQLLEVMNILLK